MSSARGPCAHFAIRSCSGANGRLASIAGLYAIGPPVLDAAAADARLPREMAGVRIPDSDVSVAASVLMRAAAPPVLFNHCLRTYLLGMIDAGKRSLKIDDEAVFVASILHDLALVADMPET
jgi:hypothetical protein